RPAAISGARWANERVPPRLSDPAEILAVDEQTETPEPALGKKPDNRIRHATLPVRVLFQRLPAGVVKLDADTADVFAFPHAHDTGTVTRSQGGVSTRSANDLPRVDVGVGRGQRKRRPPERANDLHPRI